MRTTLTILLALTALSALPLRAHSHEQHAHGAHAAGEPGDPEKPSRTIEVGMTEMAYAPARIEVKRGEQIRFVIRNTGADNHEFLLATTEENLKHGEAMKEIRTWSMPSRTACGWRRKNRPRSCGNSPRPAPSNIRA